MKISKTCRYLVRIREYETAHIEVGAEISHYDLGYTDDRWARRRFKDESNKALHKLLNEEIDRLAREELEVIAEWSEISPNLAEDYLSTPAIMQRNQHAPKADSYSTSGGRLRGGKDSSPSSSRPVGAA